MTIVLLFHHAQGQTKGLLAFADELREAGHIVHTPDLYDGTTFEDLDEGVAHAGKVIGFDEILGRGTATATDLPADIVYAGFIYPRSGHLFADSSLGDYDELAAGSLEERTLAFLQRVG